MKSPNNALVVPILIPQSQDGFGMQLSWNFDSQRPDRDATCTDRHSTDGGIHRIIKGESTTAPVLATNLVFPGRKVDDLGRPIIDEAIHRFVEELLSTAPTHLGHIEPARILFVAGAARGESKASIRPLTYGKKRKTASWIKPRIIMRNVEILYEIALRPRFFLSSTPLVRMTTIAHELWHIAPAFDGTLAEDRRHQETSDNELEQQVTEIIEHWRERHSRETVSQLFFYEGEMMMSAWLSRPPSRLPIDSEERLLYTEEDLFRCVVTQR